MARSGLFECESVSDYSLVRPLLDEVWPVGARTDSLGQKSVRFGKSGFAKAAITSNQEQFTRFSRLNGTSCRK